MKHKLIKLSDTHYIVVDNSEIKPNSYIEHNKKIYWCTIVNSKEVIVYKKDEYAGSFNPKDCFNISHSTQPLETKPCRCRYGSFMTSSHPCRKECEHPQLYYDKIKPISLSEVEEVIYGYSAKKMADDYLISNPVYNWEDENIDKLHTAYTEGFKAHKELVKDRLFTEEDMRKSFREGLSHTTHKHYHDYSEDLYIQSLLPKTEWDIKFNEQGKIVL